MHFVFLLYISMGGKVEFFLKTIQLLFSLFLNNYIHLFILRDRHLSNLNKIFLEYIYILLDILRKRLHNVSE